MASYNPYLNNTNHTQPVKQNVTKKVFINPNFQRNSRSVPQNGMMYLNPLYPQHPNLPLNQQHTQRIFVNPNFVQVSSTTVSRLQTFNAGVYNGNNIVINTSLPQIHNTTAVALEKITPPIALPSTVAKSRYSIVRKNNDTNVVKNLASKPTVKVAHTLKINKYKSISMDHAKKNLGTLKAIDKPTPSTSASITCELHKDNSRKQVHSEFTQSRFKFIKKIPTATVKSDAKVSVIRKQSLTKTKIRNVKVNKKNLKKNNIPCPLFKKYGKCLRVAQGHCEFLHDKKHVSVCRKFVKGICHDKDCLLSHEVTLKKMPTCSFYLRGMCTKQDCPYLHVKLNEKAKICTDFLKGFCEQGDKCLNRHLNICPDEATKGTCTNKRCQYPHKLYKGIYREKTKLLNQSLAKSGLRTRVLKENSQVNEDDSKGADCRYYRVTEGEGAILTSTESIKPTRCKLGALPSFIQL